MPRLARAHPGRIRRICALSLIIIGLMLGALFAVSARWWFGYASSTWVVDLGDGALYMSSHNATPSSMHLLGWHGGSNETRDRSWMWTWWTWGEHRSWLGRQYAYTVWPLAPLLLISGGLLFLPDVRARRRRRRNLCIRCGYSRDGLIAQQVCPECGQELA